MDIADVARRTGVPSSTLRYYQKKGLLTARGEPGQRRQFTADVAERLALIALGQTAGFSLDEISTLLVDLKVDRAQLLAKADELDSQIKTLQAMSKGLRHAAECPAADHLACPRFRRLMAVASARSAHPNVVRRLKRATGSAGKSRH